MRDGEVTIRLDDLAALITRGNTFEVQAAEAEAELDSTKDELYELRRESDSQARLIAKLEEELEALSIGSALLRRPPSADLVDA